MTPDEQWKSVVGYKGCYEVSDLGRVRSLDRVVMRPDGSYARLLRGRDLAGWTRVEATGVTSRQINLSRSGRRQTHAIHALVMEAFVGPRPAGADVCHNNGDGTDNRLCNLRYDSRSANLLDSVRHGTHRQAQRTHCPRGHLLVEPNLCPHDLKRGFRNCRACIKARPVVRRARAKGRPCDMQQWSDDYYAEIMRSPL